MRKVSNFCDFFVICDGASDRRVRTITKAIDEGLGQINIKVSHIEGEQEAMWVLLDIGDIVVHIFEDKVRDFYNLEYLWRDAPRIEWSPD
jgi:ribosome-associated protein